MKKILIIGVLLLASLQAIIAQQLPLFDQYMLTPFLINPAVAGSDGYTTINLTARSQWLGLPGAPNNQVISVQTRLLKRSFIIKQKSVNKKVLKPSRSGRVGLGGYLFNDLNGNVSRTGAHFSYAYHLRIKDDQLSFGLGGTAYQFHIRQLDFFDDNEPLVNSGINQPVFVPDADFGMYYLSRNYFLGFSAKNLLQSYVKVGNRVLESYRLYRHFYLTGGYRFEFRNGIELEPSALFKMSSQLRPQVDINLKAYYMQNLWAGLSIRSNGSLITLFGVNVDRYYFGYAFDLDFNSIMKRTYGSHEFMVSLKLGDNARRYRWLDRY